MYLSLYTSLPLSTYPFVHLLLCACVYISSEFELSAPRLPACPPARLPAAAEDNAFRVTSEEKRAAERLNSDLYNTVRHASEVHRQVRRWAQSWIEPGVKLIDMCERIEAKNRELVQESGLQAGIGFPTGCSVGRAQREGGWVGGGVDARVPRSCC